MIDQTSQALPDTFAHTPAEGYIAVIFSSQRSAVVDGYGEMAVKMVALAAQQPGFLGVESARGADGFGITVSYWESQEAIQAWRQHPEHQEAIKQGYRDWYDATQTRVASVSRSSTFIRR